MSTLRARVLVVDDEPNIRKLLQGILSDEGYEVISAADVEEAGRQLLQHPTDLILLDVMLPGTDGLGWLRSVASSGGTLRIGDEEVALPAVIMMSGHGTIGTAVEATRLGALDFIEKPISVDRLLLSMENALQLSGLRRENRELRRSLAATEEILGDSAAMVALREAIARAAPSDARVLITGENGTGKELVARAICRGSGRARRPFIKVNCAAIPSELLESELFGHERGAFTGAVRTRRGKFELADGGTLLLDEIGDMNPTTQAKLLRVLEEREMERVGGERTIPLDVRVLSSTNQDLEKRIESGSFRVDLYHRLKVIPIAVPALRDRRDDVEPLALHYLRHFAGEYGRGPRTIDAAALDALRRYDWPGNVRELKNLMERLVIMIEGPAVSRADVDALLAGATPALEALEALEAPEAGGLSERLHEYERQLIREGLAAAGGNIAAAARSLGVDRANLHRKIQRLGLDRREDPDPTP